MERKTFTLTALIFFLIVNSISAQQQFSSEPDRAPGKFIISLTTKTFASDWTEEFNEIYAPLELEHKKVLSATINAHLLTIKSNPENLSDKSIIEKLHTVRGIRHAGPDRYADYRQTEPDDPLYIDQWHLQQIMAPEAWELTKGGTTALGDTVVIAILDSGIKLDHPDLQGNIWRNRAEIPGNGIDDDGNGYIDDYYGLNVITGDDQHNVSAHGTEVAGVAGAITNNGEGVSAPLWESQLMILSNSTGRWRESQTVEALDYALEQRRRYNQSNGSEGAFVVSANLSFGWENGKPDSFPLLCEMFNAIGMEGIIGVSAATNRNINVDTFGDIPTLCPSPFLLAVTSSDRDDLLDDRGYGKLNVDLAAPGRQIWTTTITQNEYFAPSGTSLSAPLVAAAVALLYSVDCLPFAEIAKSNPAEAASIVKKAILEGVDVNENLQEFTASGGRLNLFNSLLSLSNCETEFDDLTIVNAWPNPFFDELNIEFRTPDLEKYEIQIIDMLGRNVLNTPLTTLPFSESIIQVDLSQLPVGMYLLFIPQTEGKTAYPIFKRP